MEMSIKGIFQHYLYQLEVIVSKIPPDKFSLSLSDSMLSLEDNAKIASDFTLRGYCPLLEREVVSFFSEELGKAIVLKQIADTLAFLKDLPEIEHLHETKLIKDKAGFSEVALSQPLFLHQYIFPNFFFHISIVYAIAQANGVDLGKADFDGIHSYPEGFSFE